MGNIFATALRAIFRPERNSDEAILRTNRKSFEIGDWDEYDFRIWDLIDWTHDYIVFIDKDFDLDYRIEKTIPPPSIPQFNNVMNQAALLERSISQEAPLSVQIYCKRLIGEAISCAIEEDFENTRAMLDSASAFILARNREISRIWYLSYSALWTGLALLIGTVAMAFIYRRWFDFVSEDALWIITCGVAGAVGALLSIISRTGSLEFDAIAGLRLHRAESASKIGAGVIAGMIAGLAIKSGLALQQFQKGPEAAYVLLLAACGAGAGERFVDSIISNVNSLGLRGRDSKLGDRQSVNPSPQSKKQTQRKRK